jgi:hypothetical protein
MTAIFQPKRLKSMISIISLTSGDAMRNENVIPSGTPDSRKLINKGIAEQEQNGEITPKSPARQFAIIGCIRVNTFLIFVSGTQVRRNTITKIISIRSRKTFRRVERKKMTVPETMESGGSENNLSAKKQDISALNQKTRSQKGKINITSSLRLIDF